MDKKTIIFSPDATCDIKLNLLFAFRKVQLNESLLSLPISRLPTDVKDNSEDQRNVARTLRCLLRSFKRSLSGKIRTTKLEALFFQIPVKTRFFEEAPFKKESPGLK